MLKLFLFGQSRTCNGTKRNEIETKRNETERNEIVSFLVLVSQGLVFRILYNFYLKNTIP